MEGGGGRGNEGGRQAGRKGIGGCVSWSERAMELDERETEIADSLSIQGLETFLIY